MQPKTRCQSLRLLLSPTCRSLEVLDALSTIEELAKATNSLASKKAPEADGISPETLKTGKPALMQHLYKLFCLFWEKAMLLKICGTPPLSPSTRNKSDCSDCNNYVTFRSSVFWEKSSFSLPLAKACILRLP